MEAKVPPITEVLVTGSTGFIGAHVVDALLNRGFSVRCATRSKKKGDALIAARPKYKDKLKLAIIEEFSPESKGPEGWGGPIEYEPNDGYGGLEEALKDCQGVVHCASPFSYDTQDNEKELILPAINGVRALLSACSSPTSTIRRIVLTSSFASIIDVERHDRLNPKGDQYFTYTSEDWNPLTYEEAAAPYTSPVVAYRGSKKFAESEAWGFVNKKGGRYRTWEEGGNVELVVICPPMTFGPVVHPVGGPRELNESNKMLWQVRNVLIGRERELPVSRVPFWVDVRDLAVAHVEALVRPEVVGKRFIVSSPERFSYGKAVEVIAKMNMTGDDFDMWEDGDEGPVGGKGQEIDMRYGLDGVTAEKELGITYRSFKACVEHLIGQVERMKDVEHEKERGILEAEEFLSSQDVNQQIIREMESLEQGEIDAAAEAREVDLQQWEDFLERDVRTSLEEKIEEAEVFERERVAEAEQMALGEFEEQRERQGEEESYWFDREIEERFPWVDVYGNRKFS